MYKELDCHKILSYLEEHPVCTVDSIMKERGAEPLRVYPLLFELAQEKKIRITEETGWGYSLISEFFV